MMVMNAKLVMVMVTGKVTARGPVQESTRERERERANNKNAIETRMQRARKTDQKKNRRVSSITSETGDMNLAQVCGEISTVPHETSSEDLLARPFTH